MSQPPSQPHPGEPPYAPQGGGLAQPGAPYDRSPAASAPTGYPHDGHFQPGQALPGQIPLGHHPQPGYQQPGYQQPGYPQPGYPQPGYPQPGYPQPGYTAGDHAPPGYQQPGHPPQGHPGPAVFPGFPVAPSAPPRAKSPMLPILLGSVAVLLVLCVGGIAAAFFALRTDAERTTGSPAPAGTAQGPLSDPPGTTTPTTDPRPAAKVQLLEPARLNGRPRLTDPQFAGAARSLRDSLSRAPGATDSIGALYGDPAKRNIVIVAAVAAPIPDPERELSATLLGAGTTGMKLTGVVTVPPGPLGGRAQCGNSSVAGVRVAMCAWADDGSVGWFIWYFKSTGQVKGEFTKLRGLIQKTG